MHTVNIINSKAIKKLTDSDAEKVAIKMGDHKPSFIKLVNLLGNESDKYAKQNYLDKMSIFLKSRIFTQTLSISLIFIEFYDSFYTIQ